MSPVSLVVFDYNWETEINNSLKSYHVFLLYSYRESFTFFPGDSGDSDHN